MPSSPRFRVLPLAALLSLTLVVAACGNEGGGAGAPQTPPVNVGVVTVQPQRTALVTELPGRLEATRIAQVRARVPGIVLERTFTQGSDVKAGDVLYRIDPAPLQAAASAARANLQQAEAQLYEAQQLERRYKPLVEARAVSQQEYDQALASLRLGQARVAQMKAALEEARLNLGYATVTAPIDGRIGNALVTEGALVGQGETTPMALIQQIDPIYVNFTQSAGELLDLQQAISSGRLSGAGDNTPVELVLGNGSVYEHQGRLLFSGIAVDPSTGQVTLQAEFPNPERRLLPGMYVRGRVTQGVADQAIVIPPQAVQRNPDGSAFVYVVDAENHARVRPVTTGAMLPNGWVVESGLNPGDRVVVDRFQQLRADAPVQPVPVDPAAAKPGVSPVPAEGEAAPGQPIAQPGGQPAGAPEQPGAPQGAADGTASAPGGAGNQ